MSSGLPVHDDKKRRSDAQVAAVVTYDRPKANPEPVRDAKEEEEEDHGNYVTIVELVLAKSSARRGWFTVVDSVGRLNLCGLGYGDLAIFETYRKARAVTKNVGLSVGEFKEIR